MRPVLATVLIVAILLPHHSYSAFTCGSDLDGSGAIDQPNETGTCTLLQNGDKVCPIEATQCTVQGKDACPQPGPQMVNQTQNFPAGTLSGGKCVYNYPCMYGGELLSCQLKVIPPPDNQCTSSHGWPFAVTRPGAGVQYSNGTCVYTVEVNGLPLPGETISVPVFMCDTTVVYTDGTGSYCPVCPNDVSRPCAMISSVDPVNPVCSLNDCIVDATTLDPALVPPDIPDYSPAEDCAGILRVFGGRSMRCRPSGTQTMFHNCCNADNAIRDSLGSSVDMLGGTAGLTTTYKAVQAGYYAYQMSQGVMSTSFVMEGFGVDRAVIEAARQAAIATTTAGEAASVAVTNYLQATLLNPTTIAITVLVIAITQLLGNGCDQEDITTATLNDSGYCVQTGTECLEDWWLIGCVQDSKKYCCFNSKLARIIHEQARPQLKSFQPDIWADCRGFTPEEFQMIDFSKVDLSEYFGDLQKRAQGDIEQNIAQGVQNYLNNLP